MTNEPTKVAIDTDLRSAMLRSIQAVAGKSKPDEQDLEEDIAAREAKAKARALEEANEDLTSFRQLREKYATWVYKYLVYYSIVCACLLASDGSSLRGFHLPESVLDYLVGSTAVSAIGLVLAVTHGLFKR